MADTDVDADVRCVGLSSRLCASRRDLSCALSVARAGHSVTAVMFWVLVIPASEGGAFSNDFQFGLNETVLVGGLYLVHPQCEHLGRSACAAW